MGSLHSSEYKHFLKKLKQARISANMTQEKVAEVLKLPQSYISKCESGERRIDVIELARFSKLYKKELKYFVTVRG